MTIPESSIKYLPIICLFISKLLSTNWAVDHSCRSYWHIYKITTIFQIFKSIIPHYYVHSLRYSDMKNQTITVYGNRWMNAEFELFFGSQFVFVNCHIAQLAFGSDRIVNARRKCCIKHERDPLHPWGKYLEFSRLFISKSTHGPWGYFINRVYQFHHFIRYNLSFYRV